MLDSITIDKPSNNLKYLDDIHLNEKSISKNSEMILDNERPVPFTNDEKETFAKFDSTLRKVHLDRISNFVPKLAEGMILMGKFDIDTLRIYNYSDYEGSKWGLGMHTNEYLMNLP